MLPEPKVLAVITSMTLNSKFTWTPSKFRDSKKRPCWAVYETGQMSRSLTVLLARQHAKQVTAWWQQWLLSTHLLLVCLYEKRFVDPTHQRCADRMSEWWISMVTHQKVPSVFIACRQSNQLQLRGHSGLQLLGHQAVFLRLDKLFIMSANASFSPKKIHLLGEKNLTWLDMKN